MLQQVEEPRQTAAHAVLDPRVVGDVRWLARATMRRRQNSAWHGPIEWPIFDGDDWIDHQRLTVERREPRAFAGHLIGDTRVRPHRGFLLFCLCITAIHATFDNRHDKGRHNARAFDGWVSATSRGASYVGQLADGSVQPMGLPSRARAVADGRNS